MRVLVTGAAGLIGAELVGRLAAQGHAVTALVHRNSMLIDNGGRVLPSREDALPAAGDIVIRHGDVRLPGLGLATPPPIDLLVHAAAVTSFDAPRAMLEAVNVSGTHHAIDVARTAGARLLHISTAYVCGTDDGPTSASHIGRRFTNGYEASKAAAEALVRASGIPFVIARPSVVVGDWAEGQIARFENIYMIFKLIAERRIRMLPAAEGATLDLVPIDHVMAGLLAIIAHFPALAGTSRHLVAATPTPVPAIRAAMARAGLGIPEFVPSAHFDPASLPAGERRWHAAAAALYTAYLLRNPRFEPGGPPLPACQPTDDAWLDRLIAHAVRAGFVSARPDKGVPASSAATPAPSECRP
ncbi:SDR family oxidoreductase [Polymorphobacter sp.]|uniref:SDR family oxidoreductase n=1 Tax=Polymorphobacter sp. TaxID=1909290 RepID=UPI003F6EE6F3